MIKEELEKEELEYRMLSRIEKDILDNLIIPTESDVLELLEIGSFAYSLKNIRKEKKITQKQLAEEIHISENTIYNYESGKNKPNSNNRKKIIDFLEIKEFFISEVEIFFQHYLKEFEEGKREIEKDNKLINKIIKELKKENSRELNIIVKKVMRDRLLKLDGIDSLINGYRMFTSNIDIEVNLLNDKKGVKIFNKTEKYNIYMRIEDFIFSVLIPISENVRNILENNKYKEKNLFQNEINTRLSEQYKKILDSLEGDNNE